MNPRYKLPSGQAVIKLLVKEYGFVVSGRKGSYIRLYRETKEGKFGTVVPNHKELKI